MLKVLRDNFTSPYINSDFLTRVRARLLLNFILFFTATLVIIVVALGIAATDQQKSAIDEIVKTISTINEYSQKNSSAIEEMSDGSKNLVVLIGEMGEKIDGYQG